MSEEKIELRPAWRNYWGHITVIGFSVLFTLVALTDPEMPAGTWVLVTLGLVGLLFFRRYCWLFSIDDNRVSRHYGLISRNQQSVRIRDLRSVELSQSLFERIFNIGNLAFYSAGSADAEVHFFGILDPARWRDRIDNMMDELKG